MNILFDAVTKICESRIVLKICKYVFSYKESSTSGSGRRSDKDKVTNTTLILH